MKNILLLCRHEERANYDQRMTYEAALKSIDTKCNYTIDEFDTLLFVYDGRELKVLLSDGVTDVASFDAVFFTGWFKSKILEDVALSVALYLEDRQVKMVNTEALYTRSRSKLSQYVHATLGDISVTPFMFSLDPAVLSRGLAKVWKSSYPIIMKGVQANRGNDNYLVHDLSAAQEVTQMTIQEEGPWFIVQAFVPNDGDLRIIVMGNEVELVIHRQGQSGSHLNNTSKGGEATLIAPEDIPKDVIDQSVKLATLLRRQVTGIDMIKHKETGQYYLLEINNMPQMATGAYVKDKISALDEYLAGL